jgi:tetratricopeptide (TPR) repeat protein
MDPNFFWTLFSCGRMYEMQGDHLRAIESLRKSINSVPSTIALGWLGYSYAAAGMKNEALQTIDQMQQLSWERYVPPAMFAAVYAGLGEKDEAFRWLEKGYQERDPTITMLKIDPGFKSLHSDPRFADLLRRVGF